MMDSLPTTKRAYGLPVDNTTVHVHALCRAQELRR
jgi:hypothetical protein